VIGTFIKSVLGALLQGALDWLKDLRHERDLRELGYDQATLDRVTHDRKVARDATLFRAEHERMLRAGGLDAVLAGLSADRETHGGD
jgi:hypothetical protein